MSTQQNNLLNFGRTVFDIEIRALQTLSERLNGDFIKACETLLQCKGRIILCGLGKSGHIARKIASTFASTGTPAFFIHAGEANHGDAGMVTQDDILMAISNSGETAELVSLLPLIKRLDIPFICLSGVATSTLATTASVFLDVSVPEEACPLGLAPTSSSTVSLVMGDALAISLLQARGFTAADFAVFHPGGQLGKRLLLTVKNVMRTGISVPVVSSKAKLLDALLEISQKGLGFTTVVNDKNQLQGIYTDGDLRRTLNKDVDIYHTDIASVMTTGPRHITSDKLAAEALHWMEIYKITSLCVLQPDGTLEGVIHIHDLLSAGLA